MQALKPALLLSLHGVVAAPNDSTKRSEAVKNVKAAQQANNALTTQPSFLCLHLRPADGEDGKTAWWVQGSV